MLQTHVEREPAVRHFDLARLPVTSGACASEFLSFLEGLSLDDLQARMSRLTAQEAVVLDHLVMGHCNKDICRILNIEVTTAKAHLSRIFKKLRVKNRVQAAILRLWTALLAKQSMSLTIEAERPARQK